MKLSDKTLNLLKNFSNINQSILFKKGNKLRTISVMKNILAEADIVGVSPSGLTGITVISDPLNAGRYVAKYEYNYTANTPVFVVVTNNNYQVIYTTSELVNDDSSLQISQVIDRQYTNPA